MKDRYFPDDAGTLSGRELPGSRANEKSEDDAYDEARQDKADGFYNEFLPFVEDTFGNQDRMEAETKGERVYYEAYSSARELGYKGEFNEFVVKFDKLVKS